MHLPALARYRFYGLQMLPHPNFVRSSGHMIYAPNCNMNLFTMHFNKGYASALSRTSVNTNDNTVKGYRAIIRGLSDDINFINSSKILSDKYSVSGQLPKALEMYRRENILALQLGKTAGSKTDSMNRNFLEVAEISTVVKGKAFRKWKLHASITMEITKSMRLSKVATGPYPAIPKPMMTAIHYNGLKIDTDRTSNSKGVL